MPIYQYLCPKCSSRFELRQSFSDESVVACPKCQNGARRLFSPVPIIFKGSGFYVTDSNSKKSGLHTDDSQSNTKEHTKEDKKEDNKEDNSNYTEGET